MSFKEGIEQIERYVHATKIAVLIWGPGPGADEHFEKRKKIREALQGHFPNGEILFSEDEALADLVPDSPRLSVDAQELWHLAACDVCAVLDTSKGAGEEIAHFVGSTLARKLLILTDEKYKDCSSFPASLRKNQNQIFYSEAEYKSCDLVERVVTRVRQVALGKLLGLTCI
jgi:hypothetical protein